MSSNIRIQKICNLCSSEFTAKTTVTKYCSDNCAKKAYKLRKREEKIQRSNTSTIKLKINDIKLLQSKEVLIVSEVAELLSCSKKAVYNFINNGTIPALKLSKRVTRIRRRDLEKLFDQEEIYEDIDTLTIEKTNEDITYLSLAETQEKYSISEKALYEVIKRNEIPKVKIDNRVFISKSAIDKIFN